MSVNSMLGGRGQRQRRGVGAMQRDPAVAARDRPGARPGDLPGGEQLVEHRRGVVADPRGEHQRFDRGGRNPDAGQLIDHRHQPVQAGMSGMAAPTSDARPAGSGRRRRCSPARPGPAAPPATAAAGCAARRRRTTARPPAPAGHLARGDEVAAHQSAVAGQPAQHVGRHPQSQAEPGGGLRPVVNGVRVRA